MMSITINCHAANVSLLMCVNIAMLNMIDNYANKIVLKYITTGGHRAHKKEENQSSRNKI